jgi:hypothetical protein
MSEYDRLKKIIPSDQALANQALSRSLRQVTKIFDTNLPDVAAAVSVLESNKDLDLINNLTQPLPPAIANFWANTFPTGTGAGNAVTVNDLVGVAAGAGITDQLNTVTTVIETLDAAGQLDALTGNGGSGGSVLNGIYTLMDYTLAGTYSLAGNVADVTTLPTTNYFTGAVFANVEGAFSNANGLIAAANSWISNIAANNASLASQSNQASDDMASQVVLNQDNLTLAGIDFANVVLGDWSNANIQSNQISASLSLTSRLHEIGLNVSEGGAAQFFDQIANTTNVTGQAVIASMREGRNIAVLNAIGIDLATQLPDINANTPLANNISDAQYTVAQAQANIVI